jgi:hypothetical protein
MGMVVKVSVPVSPEWSEAVYTENAADLLRALGAPERSARAEDRNE